MQLVDSDDFQDFRRLAKSRLPGAIFSCINGSADDVITQANKTRAFDRCGPRPSATIWT